MLACFKAIEELIDVNASLKDRPTELEAQQVHAFAQQPDKLAKINHLEQVVNQLMQFNEDNRLLISVN